MSMQVKYYLEINLLCVVLLILVRQRLNRRKKTVSTTELNFNRILTAAMILCLSDMVAGVFRGATFPGARALLEISNLLYYESITLICFFWTIYVNVKMRLINESNRKIELLLAIPLLLFTAVALVNPYTHFLFTIGEGNLYERGPGIYFHWVVTWLYFAVSTAEVIYMLVKEKNKYRRRKYYPLLTFVVPPIITSLIQMFCYGITSIQIGIVISVIAIAFNRQSSQVYVDDLTKLQNRRGMNRYLDDRSFLNGKEEMYVFMMDLNGFKQINDRFGHIAGDNALQCTAEALKAISRSTQDAPFLCRYGGDEFVMVGGGYEPKKVDSLRERILTEFEQINLAGRTPYKLELSIGVAHGKCVDYEDIKRLIGEADNNMYEEKKQSKKTDE